MRLRAYLARRAIQTIVTLLIVLVLLFVIFRLMPGDPTRFFIRPGQTQADRDQILVDFGFAKWQPQKGNGLRTSLSLEKFGGYSMEVTVNASNGDYLTLFAGYGRDIPRLGVFDLSYFSISKAGSTDQSDFHPGDLLDLNIAGGPNSTVTWQNVNATATLTPFVGGPGVPIGLTGPSPLPKSLGDRLGLGSNGQGYQGTIDTAGLPLGVYVLDINVTDRDTNTTSLGVAAFGLNTPDISPFVWPAGERRLTMNPRPSSIELTVNITHPMGVTQATVRYIDPTGAVIEGNRRMVHPQIAVRNNPVEEFVVYMGNMLVLNFGDSFYTRRPVWEEISKRVGPTMLLFGSATIIGAFLGIGLGAIMAWRRGSRLELGTIVAGLFFSSMPVFWLGLVLIWVFAVSIKINAGSVNEYGLFPLGGFGGFNPDSGTPYQGFDYVKDVLWHLTLPLANLLILGAAGHILLMRNSMLEVMGEDYIMTARAKGVSERGVMYKHAARNALLPVVTSLALSIGGVISGGVLTETIFTWPGMGYYLVSSTLQQDFPAVQGAFYLLALITIFSNMVADVLYAFLDPRVRL